MLHIGIAACSAEGAALCYRTICQEAPARLGAHVHPEISLHTPPLSDYVRCLEVGDLEGISELMRRSSEKLSAAGADFIICPDNTIHQAFDLATAGSPRPWLHIATAVAEQARAEGRGHLALMGTRWLMESDVYANQLAPLGIDVSIPEPAARIEIDRIIMDELVYGQFTPPSIGTIRDIISDMKELGCDAVILGCTELPLVINETNSPLPVLDSTRLLARAALAHAIQAGD